MIKEPYIKIKTIDYSNLSDTVPDSLNVAMVINSDTGPTAVTKISTATDLIKYYSTKQQLNVTDDVTFKHAAKLLQFTPVYLTRAFDNSVIAGYTDRGDLIYTDLEYNHLPFSLKVEIPEPIPSNVVQMTQSGNNEVLTNGTKSYDKYIGTINSDSKLFGKFFKISKSEDKWTLVSENNSIISSSLSEVSNRYLSDWSWIRFSTKYEKDSELVDTKLTYADYFAINGYSFYPDIQSGPNNTVYPNITVAVPVRYDSESSGSNQSDEPSFKDGFGGLIDYQLGLLEKFNSGEYGLSEAYGFINGVFLTAVGLKVDFVEGDIENFYDDSFGFKVYPNSIRFTQPAKESANKLVLSTNSKVYTLPYDPSYIDNSNDPEIQEKENVDTSEIFTVYGLIYKVLTEEPEAKVTAQENAENLYKLYIRTPDIESYTVGEHALDWTDKKYNIIESALESVLPTSKALSSDATVGSFWIRIQDYVFYNINIDDIRIRNNPDLEQIKISTVELTYKQLLVKLRKAVGDVFNSINTPNGLTLFWRAMPDRTKFGSSMVNEQNVLWNGKELIDGGAKVTIHTEGGVIKSAEASYEGEDMGYYTYPPVITVEGGNGKAKLAAVLDSDGRIKQEVNIFNGGLEYKDSDTVKVKPAVQITDSTPVMNSAKFAVIARFPSKAPVLKFSYIRQDIEIDDGDPELYTFTLEYKGENIQESTISFVPDKIDGYQRSVYFTYFNDINDFVQIIPLEGEINFKKYTSELFGNEIPVVEPEVDDYISASQRFKTKDGTYYDFVFDGGYVNAAYAKNLMEMCKGGNEDSLWAQAMLSCIDDKDYKDRIMYREATTIDNCNAQMFGDWVVDTTIADFSIDLSCAVIAIEKIFANRAVGKEFACIFGPANGAMQYKPKYPIIDKDIREKLLNKQINTLIWDNSLQLSYFNLDLTMQTADSSMSDCNNCRTVNCQAHIADNYMKWFWGRVNDEATRNEAIQGLMYRINQRCINNQQYHIDDYIIVCNETNNPISVIENRQMVVDIKDKFRPGIRYIDVFNKIYRLSQDFNAIG